MQSCIPCLYFVSVTSYVVQQCDLAHHELLEYATHMVRPISASITVARVRWVIAMTVTWGRQVGELCTGLCLNSEPSFQNRAHQNRELRTIGFRTASFQNRLIWEPVIYPFPTLFSTVVYGSETRQF